MERSLTGIDPALRRVIRGLVAGELPWPLLLHGPQGVGKTCATLCLLDHAGGEYYTVPGLHELLVRAAQGRLLWYEGGRGGNVWPERIWDGVARAPLVVLDEIGCWGKVTDAHYEAVKRCADERHGLPFVAVSNLAPDAIAKLYDGRIHSRLAAGTVIELAGRDRRIQP